MRSVSVLVYQPLEHKLEMRACDYNTQWTTAVEMINDDSFLAAENSGNLYVLRKNGDGATDEERARLEVTGEFYLGSFVDRSVKSD